MTDPEAIAQAPATAPPRRRRRWAVLTLAAVVVAGVAAGLVVWAPWVPPPVLRPAGLRAGAATANSVTVHWSRPRTGPLPDKYLILSNGAVAGSVAGTATSYRQAGLTPATAYQYRVVAVRGGKRSPQSALVTVHTLTPPVAQARLQGPWKVHVTVIRRVSSSFRNGTQPWGFVPVCAAGACNVTLSVTNGAHPFSLRLTRAGAVYQGHTVLSFSQCGTRGNSIPDPTTLKVLVRATAATGEGQVWAATALTGTVTGSALYVSAATFYCPASTFTASLSGTPG
jgi:hypothetical protein